MEEYYAIGLMSGTSLDGLDIAYTKFTRINGEWSFSLLKTKSVLYSPRLEESLRNSVMMSGLDLIILDSSYGKYLADQVATFIKEEKIDKIDVIGSHGHTVFHRPEKGFTLQVGDASWIHKKTGVTVVSDFRSQDVVLGGQGAPLVPIGDKLLFSKYHYRINIGGFANLSFEENGETFAYDICPVNTILNKYANDLGLKYDDKGTIAKSGNIIHKLLEEINSVAYYNQKPPKSLGVEWNQDFIIPILNKYKENNIEDILRTFTEHVSIQISFAIEGKGEKVLLSGGGVYNDFLVSLIKSKTIKKIIIEDDSITEFKEAIVFAFLAVLRNLDEVNCLKNVTGAIEDHSSGRIHDFFNSKSKF